MSLTSASTLMGLSGTVLDSGGNGTNGNLTVTIHDAAAAGNEVYNSGTDFNGAIVNGSYNVMLGSGVALNLTLGETYYLDLSVNGEDIDFSGNERQQFVSSVGSMIDATNITTPSLCLGGDCRSNWPTYSEAFNGTYNETEEHYIYTVGTTIYFNETLLNATIAALGGSDTQKDTTGFYLYNDSTTIYFNETLLNATITALATSGSGNTGVGYLYNASGNMYVNESLLNYTIDQRATGITGGWSNNSANTTTSLNVVSSGNMSASGGLFSWLGTMTDWITNLFVQNVAISGNLTLNGTTITDWTDIAGDGDTQKNASGYLYNDSTTVYLNETLLNATIVANLDGSGGWLNDSTFTNTSLDVVINGSLMVTQNITIGDLIQLGISTVNGSCTNTGAIKMYNDSSSVFPCFCNGTDWVQFQNYSATC